MSSDSTLQICKEVAQIVIDIAGLADPTPICDAAGTVLAIASNDYWGAAMSAASMIPYVGDLAKAGKFPKYFKTLEKVIAAASKSPDFAKMIAPVMNRLQSALDLLPHSGSQDLAKLRNMVSQFFANTRVAKSAKHLLPDISKHFQFRSFQKGEYHYQEAAGRLGVPGKVKRHRNKGAQSSLSAGKGDDSGHLVGDRFGAPGGTENLSLQNWKSNRYGTFKQLEDFWENRLKAGTGVEVLVRDVTKAGESRPFARKVHWTEISPTGAKSQHEMIFMNAHTEKSRTLQNIPPTVLEPQSNNVIWVDFKGRRKK